MKVISILLAIALFLAANLLAAVLKHAGALPADRMPNADTAHMTNR